MTIVGFHLARWVAPPYLREQLAKEGREPTKPDETVGVPDQRGSADAAQGIST